MRRVAACAIGELMPGKALGYYIAAVTRAMFFLAVVASLPGLPAAADITTGLVSHIKFDANGTATVGNDATLTNGASIDAAGKIGGCLLCDGTNDFANLGTYAASDGAAAWTWAWWVRPDALGTNDQVVTKYLDVANRINFEIGSGTTGGTDDMTFLLNNGGARFGYTTGNYFAVGTWTHVAVVYDGGGATNADRLKVFIDGTPVTLTFSGTIAATLFSSASDAWHFGWRDDSPAGFSFAGRLDDERMYSRALTAGDVTELYNFRGGWPNPLNPTIGAPGAIDPLTGGPVQ